MNTLINVQEKDGKQVVSARELYDFLGYAKQHWSKWYKKNINNNDFAIEDEDYTQLPLSGRSIDYALTLDFAKKLSMMARTEKGEEAREYFLAVEKQWRESKAKTPAEMLLESAKQLVEHERRMKVVEDRVDMIEAKIQNDVQFCSIMGYANLKGVTVNLRQAVKYGKGATKLCKDLGVQMGVVHDPRFGKVNTYPKEVLDEVFEGL